MFTTGNFKISFARTGCVNLRGNFDTRCEIRLLNSTNTLVTSAIAYLHSKDKYDKVVGKKIALTKALAESPDIFPRSARTEIWKAFWCWVISWKTN